MKDAKELLERYRAGLCTPAEEQLLHKWFHHLGEEEMSELSAEDLLTAKLKFEENVRPVLQPSRFSKSRKYKLWSRVAGVAAAVAVITLGVWLYNISNSPRHPDAGQDPGLAMNDIAPGKNTATLTLADGSIIDLDTNKTSVVITDSVKTTMMLSASTPRGGTYQVILPDGTKVWLNADSKIEFPSQFSERERKVLLTRGEAYFEVAKLTRSSFIVESPGANGRPGQQVEVLGTHFNINAYEDDGSVKTTLLEGSVQVRTSSLLTTSSLRGIKAVSKGLAVTLRPNQQASLKGETLQVRTVNSADIIDWKNGQFVFNNASLEEIMRKVSRWYDVEVIDRRPQKNVVTFTGKVSRYEQVSKVLSKLALTGETEFKIEDKKIIIIK